MTISTVHAVRVTCAAVRRSLAVAAIAAALTTGAAPLARAESQSPSFTLDMAAAAAQEIALTVQPPTSVPVKIIRSTGGAAGKVTLDVSAFANEQGVSVPVLLSIDGAAAAGVSHLEDVAFDKPLLALNLHVPALPAGGKYTGRLILSTPSGTEGQSSVTVWRFVFTSAEGVRPATIVIDQSAVTLDVVRPWCFLVRRWNWCTSAERPVVTVHARDKSGTWPLYGVTARLEPGLKAEGPGFDPRAHIAASFDGGAVADIFAASRPDERQIVARGQSTINLAFKNLVAGEYTVPLRFTAMNSSDDDAQRLTVTLHVRNHVLGAILVLVLAVLMSFIATRVVTTLRQRAAFLQRVRNMRPAWLADESPTLSVIWLRAALRQAEDLNKRYWLSGQSEIDARLTEAAGILAVLDRVRQVRSQVSTLILDFMVRRRALWKLDAITRQIGAGPLTDQDVARLKAQLDDLAKWCDPAEQKKGHWTALLASLNALCGEVRVEEIPDGARASARQLRDGLRQAIHSEPPDLNGKNAAEANYARLSILWELRSHADLVHQLIGLPHWPATQIEQVYEVVDNFWWKRLSQPEALLSVKGPPVDFDPLETYAPVVFRIETEDLGLRGSYLMQKKLTWHWTIEIRTTQHWWAFWRPRERARTLMVDSSEPQIGQFSPRPGQLSASVQIAYEGRKGPQVKQLRPLAVAKSRDFRIWRSFEAADLFAVGTALIASIISGVALYALAPGFGSAKDYLALLTWGASLDQGKNFLQSLAAYSSSASTPGSAPATPSEQPATTAAAK